MIHKSIPIETVAKILDLTKEEMKLVIYELVGQGFLKGNMENEEFRFTNDIDQVTEKFTQLVLDYRNKKQIK